MRTHTTKTARFLFGNFFLPKITFIPKQYLFIVNMYHYQQTTTIDHRARKIELATLTMKLIWNLFQLTSSVKLNLIFFRSFFVRVFWTAKICIKMFAISLCWKCFVFFYLCKCKNWNKFYAAFSVWVWVRENCNKKWDSLEPKHM